MQDSTINVIETVLRGDPTVDAKTRLSIVKFATNGTPDEPAKNGNGHTPRVYSFDEARAMLGGRSSAYVHVLCAKGFLQRFMPKGRKRSSGITGQSLVSFIEGNGGNGRATAS